MDNLKQLKVEAEYQGFRLDKYLATALPEFSRSALQKMIKDGQVTVNGQKCDVPRYEVVAEDAVTVDVPPPEKPHLQGENIPLDILFEDDSVMVINKPAGMVVHPAVGNWTGTVVNALIGRSEEFADLDDSGELRPGIVHRLDKDTSGCLIIAKTAAAQMTLTAAFADRKVKKTYAAIVCGIPRFYTEKIVTLIGRHRTNRKKMAVVDRNGKEAITEFDLLEHGLIDGHPASVLAVRIATGRTHQIRVHLSSKQLPVLGDELYGGHQKIAAPRQMLHAWKIRFPHPVTGKEIRCKAPWPEDFAAVAAQLGPIPGTNDEPGDSASGEPDGPGPDGNWME